MNGRKNLEYTISATKNNPIIESKGDKLQTRKKTRIKIQLVHN